MALTDERVEAAHARLAEMRKKAQRAIDAFGSNATQTYRIVRRVKPYQTSVRLFGLAGGPKGIIVGVGQDSVFAQFSAVEVVAAVDRCQIQEGMR
jgi:hypothetical protein